MKTHEFSGTAFEIGKQMGQAYGPLIGAAMSGLLPQHAHHASIKERDALTEKVVEQHRAHFPEIVEELQGIAEGSGIRFLDVACYAFRVYHRFDPGRPEVVSEHKCYVVGIQDTDEGAVLGGVLEDFPFFRTVHKIHPSDGYSMVTVTWPGTHWASGMNEHGLSITGASAEAGKLKPGAKGLKPKGDRVVGIGYMLLKKCRTVADVLAFIEPFETVGNSAYADATGEMVLVEGVKGFRAVRRPEDGHLIATSFFKSPEMIKALEEGGYDWQWAVDHFGGGAGKERYDIIEKILKKTEGTTAVERIKQVFSSHEGSPSANPCGKMNVNSSIFIPKKKMCFMAPRYSCSSPWEEYRF
jgi:hypothetical protein